MRFQYSGRSFVASWTRSIDLDGRGLDRGRPDAREPRTSPRNCQLASVSTASRVPTSRRPGGSSPRRGVLRVGERAGDARVEEYDGAIRLQLLGGELVADVGRARRDDREPRGLAGRLDGGDAVFRRCTRRARDDQHLVLLGGGLAADAAAGIGANRRRSRARANARVRRFPLFHPGSASRLRRYIPRNWCCPARSLIDRAKVRARLSRCQGLSAVGEQ